MDHKYFTLIDSSTYDTEGLCGGIDLRRHVAADLEEVSAFRVQEDWRRLIGPFEKPYKAGFGPEFSFITVAVPDCLPDRLEIASYALEFGFIHDDTIDKDMNEASLDSRAVRPGKIEEKGASGKSKIAAQILREMMAIDPERAMVVAKSWAAGIQHSNRRQEDTQFNTLEEYIPLWHGFVTFGWAIAFPEEEDDETSEPLTPALITASLTNDLYSFEKEREDTKVQNAILVIMREHSYSAEKAREKHEGAKQVSLTLGGPVKKEHLWLYQPSGESGVRMALSATGN